MKDEILGYDSERQPMYGRSASLRGRESVIIVDDMDYGIGLSEEQTIAMNDIYDYLQRDGIISQPLKEFAHSVIIAVSKFDDILLKEYTEAFKKASEAGSIFREEIWKIEFPSGNNVNPLSRQYKRKRNDTGQH